MYVFDRLDTDTWSDKQMFSVSVLSLSNNKQSKQVQVRKSVVEGICQNSSHDRRGVDEVENI